LIVSKANPSGTSKKTEYWPLSRPREGRLRLIWGGSWKSDWPLKPWKVASLLVRRGEVSVGEELAVEEERVVVIAVPVGKVLSHRGREGEGVLVLERPNRGPGRRAVALGGLSPLGGSGADVWVGAGLAVEREVVILAVVDEEPRREVCFAG